MGLRKRFSVASLIKRIAPVLWACVYLGATEMPAAAQQAPRPATGQSEPALEALVVTGSRIASPNEVSTSPILSISSQSIQVSGKTDITDLINQLPQIFSNDLGQDLGNNTSGLTTPGGVATADLRGLGPARTLVLIDGVRLGVGSPNTAIAEPAPDLDQIPVGLVERVEVVTGGASAAYGSDAIAGVVNFIMKKNFEGFEVDGQMGENDHENHNTWIQGLARQFGTIPATGSVQDGRNKHFDVIMGTNFADGQGNITGYLSYRHADPVYSSARDFGSCELLPNTTFTGVSCGGSSNSNWFNPATGPNAGTVYSVSGHGFVPWGTPGTNPPAEFNSQPFIDLSREDDRYNAAFMAHEQITEAFQPYLQFFFMDDKTQQVVAPAALFKDANPLDPTGAGDEYTNCSNPLLSAQEAGMLCTPAQIAADKANPGSALAQIELGRRNVEGGGRSTDFEHTNYRAMVGAKGDFADAWSYDAYGQYFYTKFTDSNQGYLNLQAVTNALLVTGTAADPKCISGSSQGCVPYNIWSQGAVTQAQLAYLYEIGTAQGASTLKTLHADITGKLGDYGVTSPWATQGVGVNIGAEHRTDQEYLEPDGAEESGLLSGFGGAVAPINDAISVSEEFLELRAPLAQDKPGAKDLIVDTGYRHSDYTTAGNTNTYKFEVQYAPVTDYRLRASYDRAIRAPSVAESFIPPIVGLATVGGDPCAPPIQYTLLQCERTGVTPAQYNSGSIPQGVAAQLSQQTSGNPNLKPEQADTYTVGLNFAPSQIRHLTGSIDYFHIQIKDEVGVIPYLDILHDCANTGSPVYCSQIVRQPTTGSLTGNSNAGGGYVIQKNYNLGTAIYSGVDVVGNYKLELAPGLGDIAWALNGAYMLHNEAQPIPGGTTYDCVGLFGAVCQIISPRWRHTLRTTWETAWNVSVSLTWRFIGPVTEDNDSRQPGLAGAVFDGAFDYFNYRIPGYNYLDLEATWDVNTVLQLRAGASNILDRDPPVAEADIVSGGAANTYGAYDLFGRQLFIAFTSKF
jgi:outer membrane receptor protein involved in Fe transport